MKLLRATRQLRTTPDGDVYAAGETKDIRGIHKILFVCPPKGKGAPFMHLMFNTDPDGARKVLGTTGATNLRINEQDVPLLPNEFIRKPFADKAYVSTSVLLTPGIYAMVQGANALGLSMSHRSGATYAGFDADFVDGKQRVLAYLRPCLAGAK